jgi:hypothetical protein
MTNNCFEVGIKWVKSDNNSPICDFYDARFAELIGLVPSREDEAEPPVRDRVEKAITAVSWRAKRGERC